MDAGSLFGVEQAIRNLMEVEKQVLETLKTIASQQAVLEQKLNNMQAQLTQINTNVQNLQNNVRKIAESNEEIENIFSRVSCKGAGYVYTRDS